MKWLKSRTIWVGLGTIGAAIASAVTGEASWQEAVMAVVGAVNIFLRTRNDKKEP